MGRSTIVSEILLFACLVVLVKIPEITTTTVKPQDATQDFLVGENTPVWISYVDDGQVDYRVMVSSIPTIVSAVNHFNTFHEKERIPFRVARSVDGSENITSPEEVDVPRESREGIFYSSGPVEKRSTVVNEAVYPTILVVMDYNTAFKTSSMRVSSNESSLRVKIDKSFGVKLTSHPNSAGTSGCELFATRRASWVPQELILYALAFWGSVERSLRNINPKISLRIAGIVLSVTRDASPYMSSYGFGRSFVTALPEMVNYWRYRWSAQKTPYLPIGSYDIVVHMTDLLPPIDIHESWSLTPASEPIIAVGSQGPPCRLPDQLGGLIVYDDFAFDGLHRAIGLMTKVLGGNALSLKDFGWPSKSWSPEAVLPLSNALKTASCLSAPKEQTPPGAPVVRIFAGEIIPSEKKCKAYDTERNEWSCWESTLPNTRASCHFLRCAKRYPLSDTCPQRQFALDGIYCDAENTKICLDGQCGEKNAIKTPIGITTTTTTTPRPTTPRPFYKKDGFLAGEDTPVWWAHFDRETATRPAQRYFTEIHPYRTPTVKRAINYWNTLKRRNGFPIIKKQKRSIDNHGNLTYTEQFHDALSNAGINHFDSSRLIEKRSVDSNEVVYPSILVVMDYDTTRSVEEHVMYALAYWGTVDMSLRNIQNPRVSLRIVGIVITKSRKSLYYLTSNQGEKTYVRSLQPMLDYWRSLSRSRDSKFPVGSYDIVVHMTDVYPFSNYIEWTSLSRQNNPILGAASAGPPCKLSNQIGGLIIYDNFNFVAISVAIGQMSKVLGGKEDPVDYNYHLRKWKKEAIDTLSNALKDTSCMSAPKEHFRPGKPVTSILAGELMPSGKQCELAGYNSNAWTCWDTSVDTRVSTCRFLYCSNQHTWGVTCSNVGWTLEGTSCNADNTKICLEGECITKPSI